MNPSKNKGDKEERAVVNLHLVNGVECERTLESGARPNGITWDLNLFSRIGHIKGECKVRKNGFKTLYEWLEGNDFLTIRADRKERLYVVPEKLWLKLIRGES